MILVIFNRSFEEEDSLKEAYITRLMLIYGSKIYSQSFFADTVHYWRKRNEWNESYYVRMIESSQKLVNEDDDEPVNIVQIYQDLKMMRRVKNKSKEVIVMHQRAEIYFRKLIADAKEWFVNAVAVYNLEDFIPFNEKNDFVVLANDNFSEDSTNEDAIINFLKEMYTEESMEVKSLVLDELAEEFFTNNNILDELNEEEFPEFTSFELFEFPLIKQMNPNYIDFTKNDIQDELGAFNQQYNQVVNRLKLIPYSFQTIAEIKTTIVDSLTSAVKSVNNKLNDSLYLQQVRNRQAQDLQIKVMLGITSYKTLIEMLEMTDVVLPFVATGISDSLSKNIDINNTCVFIYHKLPASMEKDIEDEEEDLTNEIEK